MNFGKKKIENVTNYQSIPLCGLCEPKMCSACEILAPQSGQILDMEGTEDRDGGLRTAGKPKHGLTKA